jgi:hypothetical protein
MAQSSQLNFKTLEKKAFEEERITKIGWRTFVNSTTLESNKSLYDYALESMRQLLEALFYGLKKPARVFAVDTS